MTRARAAGRHRRGPGPGGAGRGAGRAGRRRRPLARRLPVGALADLAAVTRRCTTPARWCCGTSRTRSAPCRSELARRRRRPRRRLHVQVPQRRARARRPSSTCGATCRSSCARRSRAGSASATSSRWARRTSPAAGIERFGVGTPPVLAMAAVEVGVRLIAEAGIDRLAAKGRALTELIVALGDAWLAPHGVALASPRDPARRGSHVTLRPSAGVAADPGADRPRRGAGLPDAGPGAARAGAALHPVRRRLGRDGPVPGRCSPRARTRATRPSAPASPDEDRPPGCRGHSAPQSGSGTPIGLPAGQSPAATTARRTASAVRQPVAAGVAQRPPRAQGQPVGVGLDGGHDRQPLGGEPAVVQPAALGELLGGGVPGLVVPAAGPLQPLPACCGRPRRPARARATPSISRCSSAASCPSPRCSRSVVSACHSARCGSAGSGRPRWPRPAAGRAGRPPRPPGAASRAASAASAEPASPRPAPGAPRASTPAEPGLAGRPAGGHGVPDRRHPAGHEAGREVVEGRRHDLGPDGPSGAARSGEVAVSRTRAARRRSPAAQALVGEVEQRVERLAERPQPPAPVARRGDGHALTLSGTPSHSRQRGSTVRVPSRRQAAPLGVRGGCGSAQPISASDRSALVWLHRRQAATTLSQVWVPPRLRGTTWSMLVAELAAVDAGLPVPGEDGAPRQRDRRREGHPHVAGQPDDDGHRQADQRGVDDVVGGVDRLGLLGQHQHDRAAAGDHAQRLVGGVEQQGRARGARRRHGQDRRTRCGSRRGPG